MTETRFYEDNGGQVHAIVLKDGLPTNFITGFQHDSWDVGELLRSAMCGFDGADDYDSDDFIGVSLEDMVSSTDQTGEIIATVSEKEISLFPKQMGIAGRMLFGLDRD